MRRAIILIILLCISSMTYAYTPHEGSPVKYKDNKNKEVSSKEDIEDELKEIKEDIHLFKVQIRQEREQIRRELFTF